MKSEQKSFHALLQALLRLSLILSTNIVLLAVPGAAQQQDPFGIDATSQFTPSVEPKFCPFPIAHCYCELADASNNQVVQKLGYITEYCGQGSDHQNSCDQDCRNYVPGWAQSHKLQACTDFASANGHPLDIQSSLGSHGYRDTHDLLGPSSINYPLGCGPNSSILVPFIVTDVIYAPPGCTLGSGANSYNCQPISSVTYSGSRAGSMQLSIESGLANGDSVTATDRASTVGDVAPLTQSFTAGYTTTVTLGSSVTFSKTSSYSQTWGTNKSVPLGNDGFNHEQDLINAELDAGAIFATWQNPFSSQQIVAWAPGHSASAPAIIQPFTVSELRCAVLHYPWHTVGQYFQNQHYRALVTLHDSTTGAVIPCQSMDPNLYHHLVASRPAGGLGFKIRDFYQMLTADEYWGSAYNPITSVDRSRYTPEATLNPFPYDSAINLGGSNWQCPTGLTQGVTNQTIQSNSLKDSFKYDTSYTVSAGNPTFLSDKETMTWTNTVSQENKQTNTKSVSVSIGCASPAWGQNLSNFLYVYPYFDALFGDYLLAGGFFSPPAEKAFFNGLVIDSSGKALSQVKLELSFDGKTFDAFSDEDGQFHFYNYSGKEPNDSTSAELSVPGPDGSITQTVTLGGASTIHLPPEFLGKRP